jgi:hypothetical protein
MAENLTHSGFFRLEEEKSDPINVDAKAAALAAAQGKTQLRVINCSLWPEKCGCSQRCLAQIA